MAFCKVPPIVSKNREITLEDLYAVPHLEKYIWAPGGLSCLWSRRYVNSIMPRVDTGRRKDGKPVMLDAASWLDAHRAVKQITWAPGEAEIIEDRLIFKTGWRSRPGAHVLNSFQPPPPITGDPGQAGPWIEHVRLLYPGEADEIMDWFAHRFQHIDVKINHALVLGGPMGIGKDWLLEPFRIALGAGNFQTAKPADLLKDNNPFIETLVLHIDETHNLGEAGRLNRFALYEAVKPLAAAPPITLPCADKWVKRYYVPNVLALLMTTNHRSDGIFLDPDDRRHFMCWSEVTKKHFTDKPKGFWSEMYDWMRKQDGAQHVAAFLMQRDLSKFDAGAPPRQTEAFHAVVQASIPPEDAALADALDELGRPDIVSLEMIRATSSGAGMDWMETKPAFVRYRMEDEEYVAVRNRNEGKGLWFYNKKRHRLYGKAETSEEERQQAVWRFMRQQFTKTTAKPSP